MYLLSGQSLTKADWFMPEKMGLNLEERRSTATLTLGPEAPAISGGDWLLDETEPGAGIVWRVKTINTQYDTNTRTATLEHIAATLQDLLMFGETKATAMRASGSTAPAGKCYAAEAIDYILSKHSLWTKGTVAAAFQTVSNPYNFNGDNLFAALETVTSSLEGCYWEFDLSAIPFKIHFRQLSQDVDSEMRMGRNITTLRRTVDTSRMYTRFYPIGKKDLHVTGNYVSRNENLYGVIEKVETDQSKTTAEELTAWANERLRKHAEPSVTVTISGQELSAATGEALDHFTINKQCRVPLPEYGTTITEKVTKLSWSDKITAPEAVTVTLANLREDLASIINNANAAGARGGRVSATEAKEDHAWIVDTEDHVAIIAEAVGGSTVMDGQEVNWSRVASILVDGNGIHQQVTEAAGDATLSKSWIDQNGQNVLAGVQKVGTLEGKAVELEGRLDLEAGKASLLVTATDNRTVKTYTSVTAFPETGSASYLYYSLGNKKYYEWTNGAYSETTPGNTINRAGIVSTINEDGSSTTKILGTKVSIGGANSTVSLSDVLETLQGDVLHVKKNAYYDKEVTIANVSGAGLNLYTLNFVGSSTYTLTPPDVANMIAKAQVDSGTNTLKLWTYADKSNQNPTLSFSKAASSKVSGSWSGNTFSVSADDNGSDLPISVTPNIHHIAKDGTDDHILNTYVGTNSGGTWTDHGNVVKAYLVKNGTKVELNNINQASSAGQGVVTYAEKDVTSVYDDGITFQLGKIVPFAAPASNSPYNSRFTTTNKITSNGTYYACAEGYKSHSDGYDNANYSSDRYAQARAFVVDVASTNPYPKTRTMKCVSKTFSSSEWVYRFEITVSNEEWNTNTNYKFHHNSGYT